jgi:hypothetical protein
MLSITTRACVYSLLRPPSLANIIYVSLIREKLQDTERAVEDYRRQIDDRKPENYGFASLAAVPYAHIVANLLKDKRPKGTDVILAPNPKDIVSRSQLLHRSTSVDVFF